MLWLWITLCTPSGGKIALAWNFCQNQQLYLISVKWVASHTSVNKGRWIVYEYNFNEVLFCAGDCPSIQLGEAVVESLLTTHFLGKKKSSLVFLYTEINVTV